MRSRASTRTATGGRRIDIRTPQSRQQLPQRLVQRGIQQENRVTGWSRVEHYVAVFSSIDDSGKGPEDRDFLSTRRP